MSVPERVRGLFGRARVMALGPALHRIDVLAEETTARLDDLARHLREIDAMLHVVEGRAATATEWSVAERESQARLALRVEEIEKLLSEP
jgi:hypothetical protein